ncbi:metal ABC transporter substrate-binding protein [Trichocoleus sp. FACHB-46]|uniref:Metal ABC transporter substrate-binding protein n=1 Tax=Trichocoleus desertorum GB2-A4 TaxID=2933944 RepID=A0ABV0J684_9CYAN|nr:metal ABC transporter substrate-binding protein [Trichocoleus sp. FACHB-46]
MHITMRSLLQTLSLLPWLVLMGCSQTTSGSPSAELSQGKGQSDRVQVMTTFLPMYLFTKAVTGDAADVKVLIPPGTEVHEYQSKPGDVQAIAQADVLVENGLGLESFLRDTIKSAQNSKLVVVDASQGIQPIGAAATEEHGHAEAEPGESHSADTAAHAHAEGNPHVWLDPVLVKQQITNIRDQLIKVDPPNQPAYTANAAAYLQQLDTLHGEFQRTLQKYPNCTFVTFHNAYPYLAQRYQLQQVAVVELPEDNLSPREVQNAIATVKQYKVKALFGEPGTDNKLLQSLAQDLNLTLQPLDSLEAGSLDPQYYFTAMKKNLQTLEAACQ